MTNKTAIRVTASAFFVACASGAISHWTELNFIAGAMLAAPFAAVPYLDFGLPEAGSRALWMNYIRRVFARAKSGVLSAYVLFWITFCAFGLPYFMYDFIVNGWDDLNLSGLRGPLGLLLFLWQVFFIAGSWWLIIRYIRNKILGTKKFSP